MSNLPFKTCSSGGEATLIERKSRFIGYIDHASNENDAREFIDTVKLLHPEANHHVWCYILNRSAVVKASDDGEPSGTAGRPVSEVLLREGLSDVVCVVVRYFGGILLGAGGLIRAYASGAKGAVDAAVISEMIPMDRLQVSIPYHFFGKINFYLSKRGIAIENPVFDENVSFSLLILPEQNNSLCNEIKDMTSGQADIRHLETLLMPKK